MFFRQKKVGPYCYLQIVENNRQNGKVRQRTLLTLGRLDSLKESGHVDSLMRSGLKFCEKMAVMDLASHHTEEGVAIERIGADLVFGRLWKELGIGQEIKQALRDRRYEFDVERAIYLTVLHRLFATGSDRAAEKWRKDQSIDGVDNLELHHLYRAMAFLGDELPEREQEQRTPFSPLCVKDKIEEGMFARHRDLFTDVQMVFFDTTSIYFVGEGDQLGEYGFSKDHRPDLKQMIVGMVLDNQGRPICCEMWPGNTADVSSLLPVVRRLRHRFHIGSICIVSDRGMISAKTLEEMEKPGGDISYILGARMRRQKEVSNDVLRRAGAFRVVHPNRTVPRDPSPLKIKEVFVEGRRYIVCLNEEQREKDAHDRQAIIEGLRKQLESGEKKLIGNKGYRKYLKRVGSKSFVIDEEKIISEKRFDGKWVLRTNLDIPSEEVALKYKQLWMVEDIFRTAKSILNTRPIFHKCTETIRGHVFCSFLALCLRKEIQDNLGKQGNPPEWSDVIQDVDRIQEVEVTYNGKTYFLRSQLTGCAHRVLQAVGVATPPTIREA